jgi:hypothetical protein
VLNLSVLPSHGCAEHHDDIVPNGMV